jgi:hypothetical protein
LPANRRAISDIAAVFGRAYLSGEGQWMGMEAPMKTEPSAEERRAAIAAFIARHGVKRCPTACVVPTQAAIPTADRMALKDYALGREEARRAKTLARLRALGLALPSSPKSK